LKIWRRRRVAVIVALVAALLVAGAVAFEAVRAHRWRSILAKLTSSDPSVRAAAESALVADGSAGTAKCLMRLLDDKDPTTRQAAITVLIRIAALGWWHHGPMSHILTQATPWTRLRRWLGITRELPFENADLKRRKQLATGLVRALAVHGDEDAVALVGLLRSKDRGAPGLAAECLLYMTAKGPNTLKGLALLGRLPPPQLGPPTESIKVSCVAGALSLTSRNKWAIAPLLECLDDDNIMVRESALCALSLFRDDPRVIARMLALLEDAGEDPGVKGFAVWNLRSTADPRVLDAIAPLLGISESDLGHVAADALMYLPDERKYAVAAAALAGPDVNAQESAAYYFGGARDVRKVTALADAYAGADGGGRERIVKMLEYVRDHPLVQSADEPQSRKDKDREITEAAIEALRRIGADGLTAIESTDGTR
jgi:HEAT repeat protein